MVIHSAELLRTAAITATLHPLDGHTIVVSDSNAKMLEVKDFLMQQPEIKYLKWNENHYYPGELRSVSHRRAQC